MASTGIKLQDNTITTTPMVISTTTTQSSNLNNQNACKVDTSKYPQYYFKIADGLNDYGLVKFALGFHVIIIILIIIDLIYYKITGEEILMSLKPPSSIWIALIGSVLTVGLFAAGFAGFIKLFQSAIDYQPISKFIKITKNKNVNGCIITLTQDDNKSHVFIGDKNGIVFIAFNAFLLLFLYLIAILTVIIVVIGALIKKFL